MTRFLHRKRSPHHGEAGVALVEFALVLPLLLLVLFGIIEFGRAINYWIDETQLASEGARWAVVDRNPGEDAVPPLTLQQYIASRADTEELRNGGSSSVEDPIRVCIDFGDKTAATAGVGDPVTVRVSTTFNWMPFLDAETGITETEITGSATMRLEQKPSAYSDAFNPPGCA